MFRLKEKLSQGQRDGEEAGGLGDGRFGQVFVPAGEFVGMDGVDHIADVVGLYRRLRKVVQDGLSTLQGCLIQQGGL